MLGSPYDLKGQKMAKPVHQMTITEWEKTFPHDDACKSYLQANRWHGTVACPRCGNVNVYALDKDFHWQCHACAPQGYRFSVGSAPGLSNLAVLPTGNASTTVTGNAPVGQYYVRVLAQNACGFSGASNEVFIAVP